MGEAYIYKTCLFKRSLNRNKMAAKEAAAAEAVLKYLNAQNRPYSAIDIFNNLHKAHGQTAIKKVLETLAAEKKIIEKTYGKQKIYFADQSQFPVADEAELKEMDKRIAELTQEASSVQKEVSKLESDLTGLSNSLTLEEAKAQLEQVTAEVAQYEERLSAIKNQTDSVTPEEKDRILSARERHVREWRKRLVTEVMDAILEHYPKTKKEFLEEVGMETD